MMPLAFTQEGEDVVVVSVGGNSAAKKHLADLGFVEGTQLNIVSSHNGDIILNIRGTKLAITRDLAQKIKVTNTLV